MSESVGSCRLRGLRRLQRRRTGPARGGPSKEFSSSSATRMLTVYVVLVLAVPSARTIVPLGSLGRPAILWGLVCLGWWMWVRLTSAGHWPRLRQPVRMALLSFLTALLASYCLAQAHGLPPDEVSPADSALLRALSWAGVVLLANDGITSPAQLRLLIRRIVIGGGLFALLGLIQFFTGDSIIERITIPGLSYDPGGGGVDVRSGFVRSRATATHSLEYAAVLSATMPLAVTQWITETKQNPLWRWWPAAAIFMASVVSMSRSALLGLMVGLVVLVPAMSRRTLLMMIPASVGLTAVIAVLAPGIVGTVRGLFLSIGADSSTQSRVGAVEVALGISHRYFPLGRGFGTMLPKYYILDNQILLLLIEVGVVGLTAFLLMVLVAVVQAQRARRKFTDLGLALLSQSLTAGLLGLAMLFAFFDALSFVMSASILFLLVGLCGAAANVAANEAPAGCDAVAEAMPASSPPKVSALSRADTQQETDTSPRRGGEWP